MTEKLKLIKNLTILFIKELKLLDNNVYVLLKRFFSNNRDHKLISIFY